ncbi:MAG: amidohydrolase family protein [Halobacteriaceae archaeon]
MLELNHQFNIVDIHTYLRSDSNGKLIQTQYSANTLERELQQAGIIWAVVVPGIPTNNDQYITLNNNISRQIVDRPLLAFARINGPRHHTNSFRTKIRNLATRQKVTYTSPEDIEQYAYNDRFSGFVLHPPYDGIPDLDVLQTLEDVNVPLLVYSGEKFPPEQVNKTLLEYDFPTILAHFGGYPLNRNLMHTAIDLLEHHDDLYLDTSLVRYRSILERALLEHPDRVLFGSGSPLSHPSVGVMEILTLDVSRDIMERVFVKNPERVIENLDVMGV